MQKNTVLKEFTGYVSMNVCGMIGLSCYILADTFFVAKGLGANGLAALNLAIPIYNFINGCGLMIGMGSSTKYSIAKATGERSAQSRFFTNAVFTALAASLIFIALGLFASGTITRLLHADDAVFAMTNTYLKVMLLFSPAYLLNNLMQCFVRNDGNPRLAMMAMLAGSLANIVLDYIFIFPLGMGIFGAVLATGFAPLTGLLVTSRHWLSGRCGFRFAWSRPDFRQIRGFLSIGVPSLVTEVSSGIVMIILNLIILGLLGNIGVAAYGVIANIALVVIAVFTGIGQGIQPIVSGAYGAHDFVRVRLFFRYAVILSAVLSAIIYAVMNLGSAPITAIFNSEHNPQLQQIAESGMKLYFLYTPFAGFNIVASMYFASVEKAVPAQIISLTRGFLLIIPLAFLLSALFRMTGVWMTFPLTELLVTLIAIALYRKHRR